MNVQYLEQVQPKDLDASERLRQDLEQPSLSENYITQFMAETFHTPRYYVGVHKVQYAEVTGQWNVVGKECDSYDYSCYFHIWNTESQCLMSFEDASNLRDTKIYDGTGCRGNTGIKLKETMLTGRSRS